MRRRWELAVGVLGVVVACATAACGKKGPPLAPIVRIPAPIDTIAARRSGRDVYVTLTVPVANIDATTPADLTQVEVYGYTGRTAPPRGQFAAVGALIATIPVLPPPRPVVAEGQRAPAESPSPPQPEAGAMQGAVVTIHDALSDDELVQGKVAPVTTRQQSPAVVAPVEDRTPPPLRRFYMAVGWGPRAPGPPGTFVELPLTPLPDPPATLDVTYSETLVTLAWEPSGGTLGFLLDRTLPDEPSPIEELDPPTPAVPPVPAAAPPATVPPGPTLYNIYRTLAPDPLAPPVQGPVDAAWHAAPPIPLNPLPTAALFFRDEIEFSRERCYFVRPVRGTAANLVEGEPSPTKCFTPIDVFPPAAPRQLDAVASEGAIDLIWEPNAEADLGGYIVLRGEAGSATLHPLAPTLTTEARYHDATAKPGVRYVYAVMAVDNRLPVPNWSAESNRVEEPAR